MTRMLLWADEGTWAASPQHLNFKKRDLVSSVKKGFNVRNAGFSLCVAIFFWAFPPDLVWAFPPEGYTQGHYARWDPWAEETERWQACRAGGSLCAGNGAFTWTHYYTRLYSQVLNSWTLFIQCYSSEVWDSRIKLLSHKSNELFLYHSVWRWEDYLKELLQDGEMRRLSKGIPSTEKNGRTNWDWRGGNHCNGLSLAAHRVVGGNLWRNLCFTE